jgi:hypothetical protein
MFGRSVLDRYVRSLNRTFATARDKHGAHKKSQAILQDMAADDRVLPAVLERHIQQTEKLNTKNFPSLGFDIETNAHFVLVANSFFPHPAGATDVTFNSVHHHGELLLTTVSAFGPGYEHWLFTTPKATPEKDLFAIGLTGRTLHPKGNIAFVDAFIPHAVMYPTALTMTYALWSSRRPVSWRDHVKRLPLIQANTKKLKELALKFGLRRALDLKVANYYDYFPADGGFCGMLERKQFERGPNTDYLQSLVSILQSTNNERLVGLIERAARGGALENSAHVGTLVARLERGERISPKFSEGLHLDIPHMNFKAEAILQSVA